MNLIKELSDYITFPKLKKCPYCFSINILKKKRTIGSGVPMVEILSYNSPYKSLENWTLKTKFKCRNCKIKLGFFIHKKTFSEAIMWLDFFVYSGVTKPFLKHKNYNFLKAKKKKIGLKQFSKHFLLH